jgi:site-specific DNA recombinase
MKRYALYARYSSDLQTDKSIEDQIRECSKHIEAQDGQLVATYADHAMSGSSKFRPHYLQMLEDAAMHKFTHVIAEALDRLSRDQEDLAALHKHLTFHGIKLVTLSEGEINELHVGLKGTMNALFLKDLAIKTRRGLEGRIKEGRSAGGKCYGYDILRDFDSSGQMITGQMKINPYEAEIINRIFIAFAEGQSPRQIAKDLNAENIPAPAGPTWVDTAIRGHPKKGTGILNNTRYVGRLLWNRQHFIKDPRTGKRVSRLNPQTSWVQHDVPELRIISDNLWKSVKARQELIAATAPIRGGKNLLTGSRRMHYLLSGLLICGECGGGYTLVAKDRYGCANRKNRGSCQNSATIKRQVIEGRVLGGLKGKLLEPEYLQAFMDEYLVALQKVESAKAKNQERARKELIIVEKRLSAILNAIEQGIVTETTKGRLVELEGEKKRLYEGLKETTPLFQPDIKMITLYQKKVRELEVALYETDTKYAAIDALKPLINKVILKPTNLKNEMKAELYGDIAGLVSLENTKGQNFSGLMSQISVVAGAGFEPATFRL